MTERDAIRFAAFNDIPVVDAEAILKTVAGAIDEEED